MAILRESGGARSSSGLQPRQHSGCEVVGLSSIAWSAHVHNLFYNIQSITQIPRGRWNMTTTTRLFTPDVGFGNDIIAALTSPRLHP